MFGEDEKRKRGGEKPSKDKKEVGLADLFPDEKKFVLPENDREVLREVLSRFEEQIVLGDYSVDVLSVFRDKTKFDVWYLLADGNIPNTLSGEEIEIINSSLLARDAQLDEDSLLLLQLHPKVDLIDLDGHGEVTEEMLAVDLFKGNFGNSVGRGSGEKILKQKQKLKARWERYFHIPRRGYDRHLMILAHWNRWQWEKVAVDAREEKELINSDGGGYKYDDNEEGKWWQQWRDAFDDYWPKSWTSEEEVEKTLSQFRKGRIKLSHELKKAIILHPDRGLSISLVKHQPLSVEELTLLFRRLGTVSDFFLEGLVIHQHVLGTRYVDILDALSKSYISSYDGEYFYERISSGTWVVPRSRDSMLKHIKKANRELQGILPAWNMIGRFRLWLRNRHDSDGERDLNNLLEESDATVSFEDLLSEYPDLSENEN